MSSIRSNYSVALSGQKWTVGNVTLWQSTDDEVILFTPHQPSLARNAENKRYQAAISQFRVQRDGTFKTVGGAALMTLDTGITYDAQTFNQIKEQWREEVVSSGRSRARSPRFVPLATRKAVAELLIPEISGQPSQATIANKEFGTIGSPVSLLANLTPEGAQEWVQGIRENKNIVAGVMVRYQYLRAIPASSIHIHVNGSKVFQHLSAHLNASASYKFLYAGSIDLKAHWERMVRNGAIDIQINGLDTLPGGMEEIRQNIITTFIDQAFQKVFPLLFEPKPQVEAAQAGDRRGLFGGTNFALKWRRETDVSDLRLNMEFNGYSWLDAAMDADVTTLLAGLDNSYVNEVNTELTFPILLNVAADDMVNSVAVSCTATEDGRPAMIPATEAFNDVGGSKQYLVTSQRPDRVKLNYKAKIDFKNPRFPVVEESDSKTISQDGTIVVKPSAHLGRVNIYMYVLDEQGMVDFFNMSDNDQLVVNLSVSGSHLRTPVRESARLKPFPIGDAIEFIYPIPTNGSQPQISFSAFGVVGGKLIRAPQQTVQLEEDSIFVVVDKNGIRLISKEAQLLESDTFAQRLVEAGTTPRVTFEQAPGQVTAPETAVLPKKQPSQPSSNGSNKQMITGTLSAIEYSSYGPAIWVEDNGSRQRIRLRSLTEVEHLNDEGRKSIKVLLDNCGYAESILVEL